MPYLAVDKRSAFDNSEGARWAFLAILIVVILLVVIGTLRVNKARSTQGLQPIYGTRWITPPSYIQSQSQYNHPTGRASADVPQSYVPRYTATANDEDLGYYDANGEFHANPHAKVSMPNPSHAGVDQPEAAHRRQSSNADGVPLLDLPRDTVHDDEDLYDITRPSGPPPTSSGTGTAGGGTNAH